jgi:hypothetical protein
MTTMQVKNAAGGTEAIEKPLPPGRSAANASRPVALSNEDKQALDALAVRDSTGGVINPDNYAQTLTYNGDGTVATISFTDGTNTWTQTFTYTSGKVSGISAWVKS